MAEKLTDNDIKKALEHHKKHKCFDCPLRDNEKSCSVIICTLALDLINRLEAENERLIAECDKQYKIAEATIRAEIADGGTSCRWCEDTIRGVAKAEAYKEVFEKISDKSCVQEIKKGLFCKMITLHDINTLKKEMVGENNGT